MAIPASIAMIVSTIINSSNVKPFLPVTVFRTIQCRALRLGIHVEDVLATPGFRLRIILIGAHAPIRRVRHGVHGDAAEEFEFFIDGTDLSNTVDEILKFGGIAATVERDLNLPLIRSILVFIDRYT